MNMDDETTEAEILLTMNIAFQRSLEVEGWHSPYVALALCGTRPMWHSPCVALALCGTRPVCHTHETTPPGRRRRRQASSRTVGRRYATTARGAARFA